VADADYEVVVSAGSLRPAAGGVVMAHRWTTEGVVVEADVMGAHLGCVLNDLYREAERLGIGIDGARVRATGGFDPATWSSTGVDYEVVVESEASDEEIERLVGVVDEVAEIPKALRSGTTVRRRVP
jgi:OsmC-like protein